LSFGWPKQRVLGVRPAEAAARLGQDRRVEGLHGLARKLEAPDHIEENGIRAVVELIAQDVLGQRDRRVDGRAVARAGHLDLLIFLHDPLEVIERNLAAPLLVEEHADANVVLRDEQRMAEQFVPALAFAGHHTGEREVAAQRRLIEVNVPVRVEVAVVAPGHEVLPAR
jgi:hypothetical protein